MLSRCLILAFLGCALVVSVASASTTVVANSSTVKGFLGGRTGKLVYLDVNDTNKIYWIDFDDMSVHKLSDDTGCDEPLLSPDGTRVVYGIYNIISKWPGQSSGNTGNAYVRLLSGGNRVQVAGSAVAGKQAFAPHWWVNPANGDHYIVYMDYYEKDTQTETGRGTWKQKLDAGNNPSGSPVKILDHAFDGGLSKDGKWAGEAYHYCFMAKTKDLGAGDGWTMTAKLDGGNQCCNASMSPDNNYYIMHLRIDHTGCNIRSSNDTLIATVWKPSDAEEMQTPEYSTDSNYCSFTASYSGNYYLYLGRISDGAILRIATGNFSNPHLWVAPAGNQPPTVSITSPVNGATFTAPANITINATASDDDGSVTKVEFFQGATKLGEDTTSPYSYTWSSVAAGSYTLTAKATDNGGATTTSSGVSISVTSASGHIMINCGNNAYDVAGWERDDGYVTGGSDWVNPATVDTTGVMNAAPVQVYKSVRHTSPHTYEIPLSSGTYTLRLHFADHYTGPRDTKYTVEGSVILDHFDYASEAGGTDKALVKDFLVNVADGSMTIVCEGYNGSDVFEAGIEILSGGSDVTPPTVSVSRAVLTGTASDDSGQTPVVEVAGVAVTVTAGVWTSQEVTLVSGTTTIAVTATDGASNVRTVNVGISK